MTQMRDSTESLLDVNRASKRFDGLEANRLVSLHVDRQEIVGLIGPNGSGKSVLFDSIVGHHVIDEGSISFESRDITASTTARIARLGLIRVFQHTQIYEKMSCLQCMRVSIADRTQVFLDLFGTYPRVVDERADELLDLVGLHGERDTRARELSFGQQKSLEISMALMSEPKMLLLDEPTAGINPAAVDVMLSRLRRANSELGVTLLIIEHNMPALMSLSDRIYCMAGGEILAEGTPAAIRSDRSVISAYLGTS